MTELEQKQFVRDNYLKMPVKRIAAMIGRSGCFVIGYMKRENLIVPSHIIQQRKKESYFKKEEASWNKGKKISDYMSAEAIERSTKTRFKKGNLPHNTNYDGHISVRMSKGIAYKWIRLKKADYKLLHRHVWEQEKGEIPKSCNVQFRDGDSLNCCIDNLYLIERKYQASINQAGLSKAPVELLDTTILITKLKFRTNEKQNNRLK